ncbi:unnamed protein product, partial [Ectocarpus sp. 12 AP-2014]
MCLVSDVHEWCRYRQNGGRYFWLRRAAEEVARWTGYQQPRGTMGCGESRHGDVSPSEQVEQDLEECRRNSHYHSKVLLLGAGESGKSTFGKQLKMLAKGKLSVGEMALYRRAIRENLVESMKTLLDAAESMGIPLANAELEEEAERVRNTDLATADMPSTLGYDILKLWQDRGVQETWARKDKFWILDSTPYYMREAVRLAQDSVDITEEDVVMTRVMTSGVGSIEILDPPIKFTIVDVGGQRNERKKWLHCFDDVKAVVFIISLAGYNQVMFEDATRNRLLEAMDLYVDVVSNPIFRDTPIHVLLNKTDLFADMIQEVPLSACFPEYGGPPGEVLPAISFIEGKCKSIMAQCCPHKKLSVTPICARVREDVLV